jgi:rRNA maturation endonuclease Nob1
MDEYLNKRILLKALEDDFNRSWSSNLTDVEDYVDGARDEYDDILRIICSMQTTDIQSVKLGKWINQYEFCRKNGYIASGMGLYYWCSNCGKAEQKKSDYCPNCGAQMDLGGEIHSDKTNN